jgi:hypothetical protein
MPGGRPQRGARVCVPQAWIIRLVRNQARLLHGAAHDAHAALLPRQLAPQRVEQRCRLVAT